MTDHFSQDDVIMRVTRLTRTQLVRFIELDFVRPEHTGPDYQFRQVDIARLELLCDLAHDLDLDETALGIVISLLDQLHAARADLAQVVQVIDGLPPQIKSHIAAALGAAQ